MFRLQYKNETTIEFGAFEDVLSLCNPAWSVMEALKKFFEARRPQVAYVDGVGSDLYFVFDKRQTILVEKDRNMINSYYRDEPIETIAEEILHDVEDNLYGWAWFPRDDIYTGKELEELEEKMNTLVADVRNGLSSWKEKGRR